MKRAPTALVSFVLMGTLLGAGAPPVAAYSAHVWSNSNAFASQCLGFTDNYPKLHYNLSVSQLAKLGYSPVQGALGAGFTRTVVLNTVFSDYAFYVHSHGDNYWASSGAPNIDSGFMQDPGAGQCNDSGDIVRASAIKARTQGTTYNIVIMSTCILGSSSSTMPGAFQIEKVRTSTDPEFFLGYQVHVWDSASYRFESAFWSYINGGLGTRKLSAAYAYALSVGGYTPVSSSEPFKANWWGNPDYVGTPTQPALECPVCH
jgi:hypothetical protein